MTEVLDLHQNNNTEKYPRRESPTGVAYGASGASRDTYNRIPLLDASSERIKRRRTPVDRAAVDGGCACGTP